MYHITEAELPLFPSFLRRKHILLPHGEPLFACRAAPRLPLSEASNKGRGRRGTRAVLCRFVHNPNRSYMVHRIPSFCQFRTDRPNLVSYRGKGGGRV